MQETQQQNGKIVGDEENEMELNIDKETLGEVFKMYLSKTAAKRASQKEKKMHSESENQNGVEAPLAHGDLFQE